MSPGASLLREKCNTVTRIERIKGGRSVQVVSEDQYSLSVLLLYEDELNFLVDEFCLKRFHSDQKAIKFG